MKQLTFTLLFLITLTTFAQKTVKLISSNGNESIIEISIQNYNLEQVRTPNGNEAILTAQDATTIQKQGAPNLPKISESLIISNDKKMQVEIISSEFEDIQDVYIAPSKGVISRNINPSTVAYVYGEEYNKNEFYPKESVKLEKPYILRDYRGVTVKFYPFKYNPVTKVLRVYSKLIVKVSATGQSDNVNVLSNKRVDKNIQEDFNKVYSKAFLNYAALNNNKYTVIDEGVPGRMLIISYGDFTDEMQDFVDWKNQKGIFTEIVDVATIGNSAAIKTYVQDYYDNNSDFVYLLLVGDNAQVPVSTTTAGDSDNNYGYLAGSDHRIDIFVGRFSAETAADVTTQVERTIHYERDIDVTESWMQYGLGVASNEGTSGEGDDGESDAGHMDNIKTDLLNYGYLGVESAYQGLAGGDAATITSAINNHIGVINYVGHGDVQMWASVVYTNTDVNALTNIDKLPFIWTVACVSGDFASNTCFGEAWQRATSGGKATGAIANIASTINQSWQSPMDAQDEMNDILIESYSNNIKRTFGGLSANGWGHMIDEYSTDGENMADTWTCFGDASLMVRTKQPQEMAISHSSGIPIGATSFTVNCDVEGALVCLTENNEIRGTAYVVGGVANLTLNSGLNDAGATILVTVTQYNKVTYQSVLTIVVGSDAPICDFSGNPLTITAGESVTFTDLSQYYPSTWSWTFAGADVTSSNLQNPVVTYSTPGTYDVSLYVENTNGNDTETKSAYITVNPITQVPVVDFSANNTTIIVGQSIDFTDLSTNMPIDWDWTFVGADVTSSSDQNPTITYNTVGVYEVSLTATNSVGPATETKTAYITVNIPDYCDASSSSNTAEYIQNVSIGTIDNASSASNYTDFTTQSTELHVGVPESITVTINSTYTSDQVLIWIDWNKDGDFDDSGEDVFVSSTGTGPFTTNITAPATSSAGETRMRIRLHDTQYGPNSTPCGASDYGEVEDYSVNVSILLSINEEDINGFEIYPNPSNGVFNIVTGVKSESEIVITDLSGKIVYNIISNDSFNTVDLTSFNKGIYFVKLVNSLGVNTQKIIIK